MKMTGNTILITGGGSGIGRGLAEAFHAAGNQVVIAGRRKHVLEAVTQANPGIGALTVDMEDADSIHKFAGQVAAQYPKLNVLVNNAGIMKIEDLKNQRPDLESAESTVAINLLGPIRLTAALLPLLRKQPESTIMTVSSGLAFVPIAFTPTHCATKAAIHSYSLSLRYQLKDTTTEVLEIIPPYVATELMSGGTEDPRAMPLDQFIAEMMEILNAPPENGEICVKNVHDLRFAAEEGRFDATFNGMNDAMAGSHSDASKVPR